jgi:hypothetical protein
MPLSVQSSFGPLSTPSAIKGLIAWSFFVPILLSVAQTIFNQFAIFPGPEQLFSLSWWGLSQGFVWQFFSYLFVIDTPASGLSLAVLVSLIFKMYLLWVIGTDLVSLKGTGPFLRFYFTTGMLSGLAGLLLMSVTGSYTALAGPSAPLLGMLIAWGIALPENELLLFFLIPMKTKWAVAGGVGALLLLTFSEWKIAWLLFYIAAVLIGYLHVALIWEGSLPFERTSRLNRRMASMRSRLQRLWPKKSTGQSKIIDLRTGEPLNSDQAFIEEMLAKISKHGEQALTWQEKKRMQQISDRMKKGS